MTQDFTGFGLPAKLLQALERMKFTTPTPVQVEAIPLAMAGSDILASAQTGTGKTGAFGIPLIAKLMEDPTAQALVMAPTRELAAQIMVAIQQMINVPTIKTALLIGGESMPKQFKQLDHHPRLIIGTPGRITDHLMRGKLKLNAARFLVLDETDRMLDMGFGPQIDKIMEYMPAERQTMMFSATLPGNIVQMSRKYMKEPKRITVGSTNTAHVKIKQELIKMGEGEKYQNLITQLNERQGSIIIFVKTKYGTEKLSDRLNKDSHKSDAIHGDLQQRRRDRVIQGFRDKNYRILVATDVAARGLDIPHIEHVINYDMPQAPEDYIHRIGRTARAGAEGCAVNFLTPSDNSKWNAIHRLMNPGAPNQNRETGGGSGGRNDNRNHRGGPRKRWGAPGEHRGERSGGRGGPGSGSGASFGGGKDGQRGGYRGDPARTADSAQRSYGERRVEGAAARPSTGGSQRDDAMNRSRSEGYRGDKPRGDRPFGDRPHHDRPRGDRPEGHRAEGRHSDVNRAEARGENRADGNRAEGQRSERPRSEHRPHGDKRPHREGGHRGAGGGYRGKPSGGGYKGNKTAAAR